MRMRQIVARWSAWWFAYTVPPKPATLSVSERERYRKARMLSVGSFFCLIMSTPLLIDNLLLGALTSTVVLLFYQGTIALALRLNRAGHCHWASAIYIGGYLVTASWGFAWHPVFAQHVYYYGWVQLTLPCIFAGLFLPFWTPLLFAALDSAIITVIDFTVFAPARHNWSLTGPDAISFFLYVYIMMFAIAIISAVYAHSVERAVVQADQAAELEQAHAQLTAAYQQLEYLATIDPVTQLLNHRALNTQLAREVEGALRSGEPLGVIFADIDHFKQVNDTYGHQVGDDLLAHVATQLRANVRACDTVARYGGEEFVVLLPGQPRADAAQSAEHLRQSLAQACLALPSGATLSVTLSLGVASFPSDAPTAEALVIAADTAMYAAKHSGRNRICVAGENAYPTAA